MSRPVQRARSRFQSPEYQAGIIWPVYQAGIIWLASSAPQERAERALFALFQQRVRFKAHTLFRGGAQMKLTSGLLVLAGMLMTSSVVEAQQPAPPGSVMAHVRDWPRASQLAAEMITQKYGPPREMTEDMLVWAESGPWKRTIVYRIEIPHNFPTPHTDVIQQFINYQVPLDMYDDLAEFDGSLLVDRTRGELSARCDSEGTNFAAINLANELLNGKRTVEDTRRVLSLQVSAMRAGRSAPYTARLMFTPPINASDPDSPVMRD